MLINICFPHIRRHYKIFNFFTISKAYFIDRNFHFFFMLIISQHFLRKIMNIWNTIYINFYFVHIQLIIQQETQLLVKRSRFLLYDQCPH